MNDRELLELAAKAYFNDGPIHISNAGFMDWVRDTQGEFDPLTDDGDALRLAVKLNMALTFCTNGDMHAEGLGSEYACNNLPDRNAAARSSIVRAAAEIGKAMEG